MGKKLLLISLFCVTHVFASEDWQLWTTAKIETKLHKKLKTTLELENRFKNDFQEYFYLHLQPNALIKIRGSNYFGGQMRQIYEKSTPDFWKRETRLVFVLTNKLKAGVLHFSSRLRFLYRNLENSDDRGALRARLGLDLLQTPIFKVYITDEIFYHYNDLSQIDRNRFAVGISGKIKGKKRNKWGRAILEGKIYYLRQDNKKSVGVKWLGTNVLGLSLAAKF